MPYRKVRSVLKRTVHGVATHERTKPLKWLKLGETLLPFLLTIFIIFDIIRVSIEEVILQMIRCIKTEFYVSKEDLEKLFACNRISAMIWNKCLELAKDYRKANGGKWISKGKLQKPLKNIYPLHSQSVQSVVERYDDARLGAKAARDKGFLNINYPWKNKKNYPTRWKQGIKLESNVLTLFMGYWEHHKQKPIKLELPQSTVGLISNKHICVVDLIWDNKLKLSITYDDGKENSESEGKFYAGIDLGEIHSISAFSEEGYSIILTGRYLRSLHRFRNKKLAEIQRKQSKCKKGSSRWKKLQRAKRYMLNKCEAQVRDFTHKLTKKFVDWAIDHKIKCVYCGNPEGVQHKNIGKIVNQKLSNWNFGKQIKYLKYKLEAKGIKLVIIGEAYTTQTCPVCGQRHKPQGRNYSCSCGYTAHRDVHGASNILSLGLYEKIKYIHDIKNTKYLRSA